MRPIENAPVPTKNGVAKAYNDYKEWRLDLVTAYGQHCVYCNDRLPNNLQVEHQVAQSLGIVSPLDWNNLYLACGPCNLAKSDKVLSAATHYLPNEHNTHLIFDYQLRPHNKLPGKIACIPVPKENLDEEQKTKAAQTILDLKLAKVEQTPLQERKMTDVRWQNRFDAFEMARTQRRLWDTLVTQVQKDAYLSCIPPLLVRAGFFSLWVQAFESVPVVLEALINALPHTAVSCFDPVTGYQPTNRNPANAADPI
ncbi:HNH endonuclease [Paraflavisolibacter sp. H34]|uniref:HNH endonuclease n=1 Tax=Huijunlia imazamoxiresistens TaxID=3127457 RepID=UPI003018CD17